MKIAKEITIQAPIEKVYSTYANIQRWREVMNDVVDVNVNYDDGYHQEFDMTVHRGDRDETVHSIRFCNPNHSIEIFQTTPPPAFKNMSGVWKFTQKGNSTVVEASRNFEIKEGSNFNSAVLEQFLEVNLNSFKNWIESHA